MEDKYKALEDKYKALEDKYKALEKSPILDEDNADNKVEDISEDKVYNVSDMLSKTQYQTPSLGELKLDFHCDGYDRNPVDGMIQVLNRIPFKPFQYVNEPLFRELKASFKYKLGT